MAAAPPPPPRSHAPRPAPRVRGSQRARVRDDGDRAAETFRGALRDVAVAAQSLRAAIQEVLKAGAVTGKTQAAAIDSAVGDAEEVFTGAQVIIEERLRSIRSNLFASFPELYDESGDVVMKLDTSWNRVLSEWTDVSARGSDTIAAAEKVARSLTQMLYQAGLVTIPDRLNRHLVTCRVGKTLDFHAQFADELPDLEERVRVLDFLKDHPGSIEGIVDPATGLVYKTDPRTRVRVFTYLAPLVATLVGAGIVALAAYADDWLGLSSWPEQLEKPGPLLTAYLFVVLGALVHTAVEALKQRRAAASKSFLAIEDVLAWLHIRYFSISASVLWVLIALFGLAASTDKLEWNLAFLLGYSIDSVAGLFLQRFETAAAAGTSALRTRLGV